MRKLFLSAICFVLLLGVSFGEAPAEPDLLGSWKMVACEVNGKADVFKEDEKNVIWKITSEQIVRSGSDGTWTVTYKIDATKKPAEIDTVLDTDGDKVVWLGIYRLDGGGLQVCAQMQDAEGPRIRPMDFTTKGRRDLGTKLMSFTRLPDR